MREFEIFPAEKLLIAEPNTLTLEYQGVNEIGRIEVDLKIQHAGDEYFCQGRVNAIVDIDCARCLNSFDLNVTSDIDFIVCAEIDRHDEKNEAIDNEDYSFFIGSDIQTDISDIVRQAIILSVSLKPLCAETCQGICAQCGINLNEKSCTCIKENIDPRWESLKKLSGLTTENKEQS